MYKTERSSLENCQESDNFGGSLISTWRITRFTVAATTKCSSSLFSKWTVLNISRCHRGRQHFYRWVIHFGDGLSKRLEGKHGTWGERFRDHGCNHHHRDRQHFYRPSHLHDMTQFECSGVYTVPLRYLLCWLASRCVEYCVGEWAEMCNRIPNRARLHHEINQAFHLFYVQHWKLVGVAWGRG